jgi:hypothetical protein
MYVLLMDVVIAQVHARQPAELSQASKVTEQAVIPKTSVKPAISIYYDRG